MELSIRTRSVEIKDALRQLIERRIHSALDIFEARIESVSVWLEDVNGPRGGVDKTCQITVALRGLDDVFVRASGPSETIALGRAIRRLKYTLAERLKHARKPDLETIRTPAAVA